MAMEHQSNKKERYVIVMDQECNLKKTVEVTEEEMAMIAYRQDLLMKVKNKN